MASCLEGLEPKRVLEIFSDLCQIPHGSKNEKAISDYIYNFAKNLNLECYQDQANNLIIKKPASPGYENAPTVILQAHMDMVCEKTPMWFMISKKIRFTSCVTAIGFMRTEQRSVRMMRPAWHSQCVSWKMNRSFIRIWKSS